jgi:hypothetical protein
VTPAPRQAPTPRGAAQRGVAQRGAAQEPVAAQRHVPPQAGAPAQARAMRGRAGQRAAAQGAPAHEPVALLYGIGQRIVHGNPTFMAEFGGGLIGLPAREVLVALPARAFDVVDRVRTTGRPLACWLEVRGERRRLTVAPRSDPESGEVYGVAIRLAHAAASPTA